MNSGLFEEAYRALNVGQREAVDAIEGPVMVIAGPGTGKTQILTLRIANILLKTDTRPENILALTFTESGVRAMRDRLRQYIGSPAYRVRIHTFHEFAGECIRRYPDAYERAVGGRPLTDLERVTLIGSILETPSVKLLRPRGNPEFYVKPVVDALSFMKREYITPDRFANIIAEQERDLGAVPRLHEKGAHKGKVRGEYIDREKSVNKNRELLFIYRAYESALKKARQFDYDDMLFETVEALERNEGMLRSLQEEFQYLLADEHQDVNGSQNRILELLASFHGRPNIFVVGDEKQSIYRFQGASLENFLYFGEKFKHAKTIALTENYRSAQAILDLSQELISVDAGPAKELRVPLSAVRREKALVERRQFSHEAVEHEYIAESICKLIAEGIPKEEIAVITRTNREVEDFSVLLSRHDIPVESSADSDILEHPITSGVRALIAAVNEPQNERALSEILMSGYVGIDPGDLLKLMAGRSYTRPLATLMQNTGTLEALGIKDTGPILSIKNALVEARKRTPTEPPHRVLEHLMRESGFLSHIISVNPSESGRVVRRLYDEVEEMVQSGSAKTLRDIEAMFETRLAHGLSLDAPYIHTNRHAVRVMTAHKAKGLEFMYVYIPHLTDQGWGGRRRSEQFDIPSTVHLKRNEIDRDDDERKLLYVAMTRAKTGLFLSHADTSAEGRSLTPTRLLEGVGEALIQKVATGELEERFEPASLLGSEPAPLHIDVSFLRDMLMERGLSATALNNYLKSPWNYFFRNVLRIPEIESESAQFGTALHDTLRSITRHQRERGAFPSTSELKTYLERELGKLPISEQEFVRHHERGLEVLVAYVEHLKGDFPHEIKEEFKFEATLVTGDRDLPEVLLTGKLDRLDFDTEGTLVRVVDYKTGKPRTRGQIEGSTKDSTGDYKRQLVFYALLLSLQDVPRYACRKGLLSFIEPDEKGKIHEEPYTITDEEIETLKTEIVRVSLEIAHGAFLDAPCDPTRSDYCQLVALLRERRLSS